MKKILITGVTGFAGSFLAEHLIATQSDAQIFGTYLTDKSLENVSSIKDKLTLEKIDLTDFGAVKALIEKIKPDQVYHLAALPATAASLENPSETIINNVTAQTNILEALQSARLLTRILIISSADIYGIVPQELLPIKEETPLNPLNPYAVSKITQDFLGLQYFNAYNMPIIRVRPFNHIGPRQAPGFAISSFAKQVAEVEKHPENGPFIKVGNLDAKRDFTDVRDMMRAYVLALEKGKPGEVYNIGSGTSIKMLDVLLKLISLAKFDMEIEYDSSRKRTVDCPELVCDNTKFTQLTGWKPEIGIEQTLKDTLEYWRTQV